MKHQPFLAREPPGLFLYPYYTILSKIISERTTDNEKV